jgi:hypothetical protein
MKYLFVLTLFWAASAKAQTLTDTLKLPPLDSQAVVTEDSSLRIINLPPYITLHVDSTLYYPLQLNRAPLGYYWFIKNAPVGLRINKDNGALSFKADKAFFLSGKLKYDQPYKVMIGVQNEAHPKDRVDTNFTLQFYNTETIPSRLRTTIASPVTIEEGENLSFLVQCEDGSFPIERINFSSNRTLLNFTLVKACNDLFSWTPSFEFVKEGDSAKTKVVTLTFIGTTKFGARDTATVKVIVRDALNYPLALQDYGKARKNIEDYTLQLKFTFLQLDRKLKKNKSTRTSFDLTTAATSLSGTILNSTSGADAQKAGKILPSIGLSMVPIKEAVASNKTVEQNQAGQLRNAIKRLEYMLTDNELVGEKDPDLLRKTNKLKEELKGTQVQLIDIPLELTSGLTADELNRYFNSKKVNKKYRLKH